MNDTIDYSKGMMNDGDDSRILELMDRASRGEQLTIGFLGGSITQGSLSSTPETCYAYLVYQWWVKTFVNASFKYLNAGIGGTTSQFGVARVINDLLKYKPDFTVVEFSVNDDNSEHFKETYEGLVRTIYKDDCKTAMMLVHNVRYDNMESAEDMHLAVGKRYQIPCVSMKTTLYPLVADGTIPNRDVTPDDLHPNDAGHAILAGLIIYDLEQILARWKKGKRAETISTVLPSAITENEYENSVRYQAENSEPEMEGFVRDLSKQDVITDTFHYGFTAWNKGDRILFNIKGTGIAVQYRKSIRRPTPVARITIDGKTEESILLDGNFDENWGDCTYIDTVLVHAEDKIHTVEIQIVEAHENDVVPFYLLSVIGSR